MQKRVLTIVAAAVVVLAAIAAILLHANRPVTIAVDASIPAAFPTGGFSHSAFERLLRRYVDATGNVAFAAWHGSPTDRELLDSYLAAVSAFSPDATPGRFPRRTDSLAYWMYGYNAYVIKSVLDHWPIDSVTDIKAPLETVTGLGFFYRQRFVFGGTPRSLYAVENDIIRKSFTDPRIHFVLYCASGSCPPLRPELPTGDELERMLQQATLDFTGDPANVAVDHERAEIVLSPIFDLYRGDFLRDLAKRGLPAERGVVDYVISVAPEAVRDALQETGGYDVSFRPYDWQLAGLD